MVNPAAAKAPVSRNLLLEIFDDIRFFFDVKLNYQVIVLSKLSTNLQLSGKCTKNIFNEKK